MIDIVIDATKGGGSNLAQLAGSPPGHVTSDFKISSMNMDQDHSSHDNSISPFSIFNPDSSRPSGSLQDDHRDEGSLGFSVSCHLVIVAMPPLTIDIQTSGPMAVFPITRQPASKIKDTSISPSACMIEGSDGLVLNLHCPVCHSHHIRSW